MGRKYIDLTGQNINGIVVKEIVNEDGGAGRHKRWKCLCPKCEELFITSSQHLRDKNKPISMCFQCSIRQYNDLSGRKFGRLTVTERDYESQNGRVKYKCICECGSIVSVQANHLISQEIQSCGCMMSSGEETISKLLTNQSICFEKQKMFDGCKNRTSLRFDFFIPDLNIVIEYQGIQHYEPVEHFGGVEALEDTIKRDQIKRDFCKAMGIGYYTISFRENIEEKIRYILSNEDIVWPHGNMAG